VPRKTRTPLTKERVLRAAIAMADGGGIDALSMRRLGQELGVQAMSLYHHVESKDDLLDGIVDLVLSEIELPSEGSEWKERVRGCAVSAHDVLLRHPWACSLTMSPARNLPARPRYMEWMLARLRGAGFSPELTYHAYHAVDSHILGFTLWELGHAFVADDLADLAAVFFRAYPVDEYPHLHEHAQQHLSGFGRDGEGEFEFVLDVILDGLDRLRLDAAPAG